MLYRVRKIFIKIARPFKRDLMISILVWITPKLDMCSLINGSMIGANNCMHFATSQRTLRFQGKTQCYIVAGSSASNDGDVMAIME